MKYKHYIKHEENITKSQFYDKLKWVPNKTPMYSIGDIVEFEHPEIQDDPFTLTPCKFSGVIVDCVTLLADQRFCYSIRYLDFWENRQKVEVSEEHIMGIVP